MAISGLSGLSGIFGGNSFRIESLSPSAIWDFSNSYSRTGGQFTAASSQYLSVASNSTLQIGDTNSWIAVWVKRNSIIATDAILSKGVAVSDGEFAIFLRNLGHTVFAQFRKADNSGHVEISSAEPLTLGQYGLVFIWHDKDLNTVNISVNNGTVNSSSFVGGVYTSSSPLTIGSILTGNYFDGLIDNLLFGKPPTPLGDGTPGSLAHTIATTLFNSNNGLAFQSITAQQQTDWGIVSGWLDTDLTTDSFGSNTLTNVNAVTLAAGKVNAAAEDNDPIYMVNESIASAHITNELLATRPIYKVNQFSSYPAGEFGSTRTLENDGGIDVETNNFSALVVCKLNSDATLASTVHNMFYIENGTGDFIGVYVDNGVWKISNLNNTTTTAIAAELDHTYILYIQSDVDYLSLYVDGTLVAQAANEPVDNCDKITFDTMDGQFAYTAIFPAPLNTTNRQAAENYLFSKYVLPGDTGGFFV